MLWAAWWLYQAINRFVYLNYLQNSGNVGDTRATFPWDDEYVGGQILDAKVIKLIRLFHFMCFKFDVKVACKFDCDKNYIIKYYIKNQRDESMNIVFKLFIV